MIQLQGNAGTDGRMKGWMEGQIDLFYSTLLATARGPKKKEKHIPVLNLKYNDRSYQKKSWSKKRILKKDIPRKAWNS